MDDKAVGLLLRVANAKAHAFATHHAGVANLATRFGVERCLVKHDSAALAPCKLQHFLAVTRELEDHSFSLFGLIAKELGSTDQLTEAEPNRLCCGLARARPRGTRLGPLALHCRVEGTNIDPDAAGLQRVLGEVERKPIGVRERERHLALEVVALLETAAFLVEDCQAALQS